MRSLNPTTPSSHSTITTSGTQQPYNIDRKYIIMAPKRKASGPAAKSQQSTLAFHGTTNRVTKSGVKAPGAKKNLLEAKLKDIKPDIVDIVDTEPTTTEAAIIEQTEQEVKAQQVESTPEEDQARRISDAAIKKYWATKEKQRLAPRAHQGALSLHEKILREFDMSAHYGVSPLSTGLRSEARLRCGYTANVICAM
jgi:DNA polymerase delta subunit 4